MKAKSIATLAGIAVGLGVLAYVVSRPASRASNAAPNSQASAGPSRSASIASSPEDTSVVQEAGTLLFPGVNAADVSRVTLRQGTKTLTFTRLPAPVVMGPNESSSWGINEKDNYPALDEKVRGLVRGVLNIRSIQPKTSNPQWHSRLGVQDPTSTSEGADAPTGHLVSLHNATGDTIASVVIGKRQEAADWDPQKATTYVRIADQTQSHAARSTFTLAMEPVDWMKRQPIVLAGGSFRSVRIDHAGSPPILVERPLAMVENYVLKDMPPGRRVADSLPTRTTLTALASLSVDDVAKVQTFDFATASTSTFVTFDGVVYSVRSMTMDGAGWVSFRVRFDEAAFTQTTPPPAQDNDQAAQAKLNEEAKRLDEERRERARVEASQLDERLAPWAFKVPEGFVKQVAPVLEDLLAPLATPDQPGSVQTSPDQPPLGPLSLPPQ